MPRSAEQQVLVDELIEFLKPYKGKSIDTEVLAEKVAEIWGDQLGTKGGPGKLSDLRRVNPEIFKGVKIEYKTRGQGDWNKAWKNDPEFREFFKKKRPGIVWEDLTVEERGIKQNTYKSYLYEKAKLAAIPKGYIPYQEFVDKLDVDGATFKEYRTNRKGRESGKGIQKFIKDNFDRKEFKKEVFYKDPTEKQITDFKKAVGNVTTEGLAKMSRTKQSVSDAPIKAVHKEFMLDPDISLTEVAKNVYGKADAQNLKLASSDISRYAEVLSGTRTIPGLTLPAIAKTEEILGNILMPGSGFFKFGNYEIRKRMMKERDKILGTKGVKFSTLRNALEKFYKGSDLAIDETAGLASTFKNAPGYTELVQRIPQEVNLLKGNMVDKDFSVLLQKITDGNESPGSYRGEKFKDLKGHVKLFNKFSKNFQNTYGIDTPIMEYKPGEKLVASNLVKNFDKLSPEAQINVTQLADQGIGIRTQAVPIAQMIQDTGDAKLIKRFEARIGCAEGCLVKTANEQPSKFLRIYESITKSPLARGAGRFGALAAAGAATAGVVKKFMNDDPETYLSNEDQQKNMLIEMVTGSLDDTPQEKPAILDYQLPALGAAGVAGTAAVAPSTIQASRSGALGAEKRGITRTAGRTLLRGLGALGTPAGLLATEPLFLAGQVQQGDSLAEIATDPLNYLGAAFVGPVSDYATKGLNPLVAKTMRLGISPTVLKTVSRRFGLPGLAISAGISGYELFDDYRNKRGMFGEE
jgi:hypothetical protein